MPGAIRLNQTSTDTDVMSSIIDQINQDTIKATGVEVPDFAPGDTLRVHVKVKEGNRERVQVFEGMCIARKNDGVDSNFTVRKVSFGEGVERVFPLYSPILAKIERVRQGDVRRAKLYYLRGRTGKAARIAEKIDFSGKKDQVATAAEAAAAEPVADDQVEEVAVPAEAAEKKPEAAATA